MILHLFGQLIRGNGSKKLFCPLSVVYWEQHEERKRSENMFGILWGVVVVLVILWLLGFLFHIAGGLIHLLLVLAVIVLIYNLIMSNRSRGTV